METDQDQQQALKQVKAFATKSEYFGIPADVFYALVGVSVAIGAVLRSLWLIVVFIMFFGVPLYQIHRDDPFALKVWVKAAKRRHKRWCAGRATPRQLLIIKKEEDS